MCAVANAINVQIRPCLWDNPRQSYYKLSKLVDRPYSIKSIFKGKSFSFLFLAPLRKYSLACQLRPFRVVPSSSKWMEMRSWSSRWVGLMGTWVDATDMFRRFLVVVKRTMSGLRTKVVELLLDDTVSGVSSHTSRPTIGRLCLRLRRSPFLFPIYCRADVIIKIKYYL